MEEMNNVEKLKTTFLGYKNLWSEALLICLIAVITFFIGMLTGLTYLSLFGFILLMGTFIGVFFGLLFGSSISWIVSVVLCLFLGVYLTYFLMGSVEAVFASYGTPVIGALSSWYFSRKKVFVDGQIESEYYKDSLLDPNK